MKIHINGEPLTVQIPAQTTDEIKARTEISVAHALQQYLSPKQQKMSYAVALNSDFVSRSQYTSTLLKDGDSIDVLFPIHGG